MRSPLAGRPRVGRDRGDDENEAAAGTQEAQAISSHARRPRLVLMAGSSGDGGTKADRFGLPKVVNEARSTKSTPMTCAMRRPQVWPQGLYIAVQCSRLLPSGRQQRGPSGYVLCVPTIAARAATSR